MAVTAFLGAYGYGNLGDELCLMEAMRAFPGGEAHAFSVDPDWTRRCVPGLAGCFGTGTELMDLRPARIVYGGGMFGVAEAFRAWLPWLACAAAGGVELHFHNLGVARLKHDLGWLDAIAREVFAHAATLTVRDYISVEMLAEAGITPMARVTHFPEADIPADPTLADALLPRDCRKLLGLSIITTPLMRDGLQHDAARVRATLAEFTGHAVIPVISTIHRDRSAEEDDLAGTLAFIREFLPDAPIAAPALLDAEMTPARLKGLIARLDALVTQRKHNMVHAIGAGTRVIGLHPMEDDSLRRTFVALSYRLPPGSRCLGLDRPA